MFFSVLANNFAGDNDEPYPSLSDYHDYEPNLEFDDSELQQSPNVIAQTGKYLIQINNINTCLLLVFLSIVKIYIAGGMFQNHLVSV